LAKYKKSAKKTGRNSLPVSNKKSPPAMKASGELISNKKVTKKKKR